MLGLKDNRILIAVALIFISIIIGGFLLYNRRQMGGSLFPDEKGDKKGKNEEEEEPDLVAELADEIMEMQEDES